jgi:hypothetical protein
MSRVREGARQGLEGEHPLLFPSVRSRRVSPRLTRALQEF